MITFASRTTGIGLALAIVEQEFSGCLALQIDIAGGSTVYPPQFAEQLVRRTSGHVRTTTRVRSQFHPLVVELRNGEMFLVELDPRGREEPVAFDVAAAEMLAAVSGADDHCGPVAVDRYRYRPVGQTP